MKNRITGLDLARAFAIFGMVIVNFKISMGVKNGDGILYSLTGLLEGRAAALFVILAGIGISLFTTKFRVKSEGIAQNILSKQRRFSLLKRGLLLIVIGLSFTTVWEADILHFYGVYFLLATLIVHFSNKQLLIIAIMTMLIFPVLLLFFDYEKNWDWTTLVYHNFWTVQGMVRHIFYNGFHPVFPWFAFLVFGMWLGRQNLSSVPFQKSCLLYAVLLLVITELLSFSSMNYLMPLAETKAQAIELEALLSTSMLPPMPQYILSATSSAVIVIIICLYLATTFSQSRLIQWLIQTGRCALTIYIAHVIVGLGLLEVTGNLSDQTIAYSVSSALFFCVLSTVMSVAWLNYFNSGPLEMVFRKLTS